MYALIYATNYGRAFHSDVRAWALEANQLTGMDGKRGRISADVNFKRLRFSNT